MKTFLLLLFALIIAPVTARADSLSDWMDDEQTRIDRRVDEDKIMAPDIAAQAKEYRPENQAWFPVKSVWIPEEELHSAVHEDMTPTKLLPVNYKPRPATPSTRMSCKSYVAAAVRE